MSFPQSNDVRNLERMISHLEETRFSETTQESVEKRVISINNLLDMYQLTPENLLSQRLGEFADRAWEYYHTQDELRKQKEDQGGEVCYVGVSGMNKIRIVVYSKGFEIVRVYHDKYDHFRDNSGKDVPKRITLDWHFNQKGRIEKVNYRLYPEEVAKTLMQVKQKVPDTVSYESGLFSYTEIPDRMKVVNSEIFSHAKIKRYLSLLRFGHFAVKTLAENIMKNDIKDSYVLIKGQVQLREIKKDPGAINMITSAVECVPEIQGMIGRFYNVVYE